MHVPPFILRRANECKERSGRSPGAVKASRYPDRGTVRVAKEPVLLGLTATRQTNGK